MNLNVENMSKLDEKFIKHYDEESVAGYILEVEVKYPERLHNRHNDLPFLPEIMNTKKCISLFVIFMIKKICRKLKNFKTSIELWINTNECAKRGSI